jgi:Mpv17 / PMP22 family
MFNYRYIPLNLRVLFLNVVALGWYVPQRNTTCSVSCSAFGTTYFRSNKYDFLCLQGGESTILHVTVFLCRRCRKSCCSLPAKPVATTAEVVLGSGFNVIGEHIHAHAIPPPSLMLP